MRINRGYFLAVLLLTGCLFFFTGSSSVDGKVKKDGSMKYNSYDGFKKKVGGFPYAASEAKIKHIIEVYPKLSLGMTKDQVLDILGEPDVETEMLPKFTFERPTSRGWNWTYYIYKSDSWGQNIKSDKQVEIFYNIDGKVDWLIANNIDGLKELGGPKNEIIFLNTLDPKTGKRANKEVVYKWLGGIDSPLVQNLIERTDTTVKLHLVTDKIVKKLRIRYRIIDTEKWLEKELTPTALAVDATISDVLPDKAYEYQYILENNDGGQSTTEWIRE